jgi:hypothetical protein
MITLSKQEGRIPIVVRRKKDTEQTKEARHEEFLDLVFKYELTLKKISEITGKTEGTIANWRIEKPKQVIPKRQFEKIKEALGLPVED